MTATINLRALSLDTFAVQIAHALASPWFTVLHTCGMQYTCPSAPWLQGKLTEVCLCLRGVYNLPLLL